MKQNKVTFLCNKLVRDKTLERMEKAEVTTYHKMLSAEQLKQSLLHKLVEEAEEVGTASNRKELIAELADVLEVIEGICTTHGISDQEIAAQKKETHDARGGFQKGVFIEKIEMAPDNPLVEYCRTAPEKYKEV